MRRVRQGAVLLLGGTLLALGAALLVLPGPGVAVIFAGLAVLATEYVWARKCLDRGRALAVTVRARVLSRRAEVI